VHARSFAPHANEPGDLITLAPDEAEHLTRVLRLTAGDPVSVFNGRGGEFESVIESAARGRVRVRVGLPRASAPEARLAVSVAQAVLKGDKMDAVVRDATMIGVTAIHPIVTTRTELSVAALERGHRRERWERVAIAATKQCGRAIVPHIATPIELRAFGNGADPMTRGAVLMLVEPGAAAGATALRDLDIPTPEAATLIVGPEGGWTSEELASVSAGTRLITLGGRTLRADAMALVAIGALFTKWGEY